MSPPREANKFFSFYGTQVFITLLTWAFVWSYFLLLLTVRSNSAVRKQGHSQTTIYITWSTRIPFKTTFAQQPEFHCHIHNCLQLHRVLQLSPVWTASLLSGETNQRFVQCKSWTRWHEYFTHYHTTTRTHSQTQCYITAWFGEQVWMAERVSVCKRWNESDCESQRCCWELWMSHQRGAGNNVLWTNEEM
jgi:hypothetical protein